MAGNVDNETRTFGSTLLKLVHPGKSVAGSLGLVLIIYILTLVITGTQGFWVADDSLKFIQLNAMIKSGYADFSLPWPGAMIDTGFSYNPIPKPFSIVVNHKLYPIFSPVFALVSTLPYKLFGFPGLYILPLIASFVMLIGVSRVVKILTPHIAAAHAAILLTGLCTPVWFYSVVFWEHIIAVCMCIWSVFFLLRFILHGRRVDIIRGSILSVLSVYFRDDMYVFCAIFILSLLVYARHRRLQNVLFSALSMLIGIIPLWILQWCTIGSPFGYHLGAHLSATSGVGGFITQRLSVIYSMIFASHPSRLLSYILTAPFILSLIIFPRLKDKYGNIGTTIAILCAAVAGFVYLINLSAARSPIAFILSSSNSLLVTAPIIILAFFSPKKDLGGQNIFIGRQLLIIAIGYVLLYCLVAPQLGSSGIHWGNRFLLLFYPLMVVLGTTDTINRIKQSNARKACIYAAALIILILISFISQLKSIDLLRWKKDFSRRINQLVVSQLPDAPLITPYPWVPSDLYRGFDKKMIFLVGSQRHMYELLKMLSVKGYDRYIFIDSKGRSPGILAEINDVKLNFYDVKFTGYTIPIIN